MSSKSEKQEVKRISIDEFMDIKLPRGAERLMDKINGGSFMACHMKIFKEYGVWVEELTPVFRKFDAMVAFRELPTFLR